MTDTQFRQEYCREFIEPDDALFLLEAIEACIVQDLSYEVLALRTGARPLPCGWLTG